MLTGTLILIGIVLERPKFKTVDTFCKGSICYVVKETRSL